MLRTDTHTLFCQDPSQPDSEAAQPPSKKRGRPPKSRTEQSEGPTAMSVPKRAKLSAPFSVPSELEQTLKEHEATMEALRGERTQLLQRAESAEASVVTLRQELSVCETTLKQKTEEYNNHLAQLHREHAALREQTEREAKALQTELATARTRYLETLIAQTRTAGPIDLVAMGKNLLSQADFVTNIQFVVEHCVKTCLSGNVDAFVQQLPDGGQGLHQFLAQTVSHVVQTSFPPQQQQQQQHRTFTGKNNHGKDNYGRDRYGDYSERDLSKRR